MTFCLLFYIKDCFNCISIHLTHTSKYFDEPSFALVQFYYALFEITLQSKLFFCSSSLTTMQQYCHWNPCQTIILCRLVPYYCVFETDQSLLFNCLAKIQTFRGMG